MADNGNNLSFHGNSIPAADCMNSPKQAITLDGTTYLSCTIPPSIINQISHGDFSLGIMLKTTDQTGTNQERSDIAGMGDATISGFFLSLHNSRGRIFLGKRGWYDTRDTLSNGKWHFLLATRSNGNVSLYLDGKISDQGAFVDSITPWVLYSVNHSGSFIPWVTDTFAVGKHGDIDQLVFYNRALTSEEAHSLFIEFTTVPVTMFSPSDTVISAPVVFKWSSMKSAVAYAVEIDTGASFLNPIISLPVEDTVMQLNVSLAAGKYYFRIGSNTDDRSPFYFINPKYFILR
jgi:hypothetical protein